ncbi:hypothetical protein L1987_29953 [Smallanthus sonchifolius]|uniref:Uncharacterized protein n=1 Tax=Smallanthus sonchifolius TaxID=185202 RepID=A0ACB9I307_9ASTR|nr:hypothetical protein L1987_29953 [Smallanthus sonchifolius]
MENGKEKGLGELVGSDVVTISLEHGEIDEINNCKDTSKEGNTEEEKTNEIVYDAPPFSIGLTQIESNNEEMDTGKEKVDSKQEQIEESNMEKRSDEVESSDIEEAITKEEELIWEYLFKEDGMMYKLYGKKKRNPDDEEKIKGKGKVVEDEESETVFRNKFNLEVEKFRFKRLKYDTKVFNKVIDAWVDVLNCEEKYRSPTSPYRLYYDTDLILKHIAISMIDNFSDAYPLVCLDDHENYFEKDSTYKVVRIPWATTANALDCAIFVMRHLEKYMGATEEFNSGLSTNGPKKNKQLKILRKKYATHILLSECNKVREKIQIEALGK